LYKHLLWIALLGWCGGCGPPAPEQASAAGQPLYFDVQGFLDRQMQHLNQVQPEVHKTVLDQQGEEERQTVRHLNWERELELFREVDLNRPALRDYFTVTRHTDPATGHTTERYERVPGAYTNIRYLEVELDANRQLRHLQAATQQDNALFYTQRQLQLSTNAVQGQPRLSHYRVSGVQKLILTDSVHYTLEAQVR
jgi:hypothetical protein